MAEFENGDWRLDLSDNQLTKINCLMRLVN